VGRRRRGPRPRGGLLWSGVAAGDVRPRPVTKRPVWRPCTTCARPWSCRSSPPSADTLAVHCTPLSVGVDSRVGVSGRAASVRRGVRRGRGARRGR
jgi:hypothetical protein